MNRIVLITGGSKGLGFEIAKKFLVNNDHVIITSRNSESGLSAKKKLDFYGDCKYFAMDVAVESECQRLIDQVVEQFGTIDILINNAAYIAKRDCNDHLGVVVDANIKKLEQSLEVNVLGVWQMIKYASRVMVDNKKGLIINIGSVAGSLAISNVPEYCISKAAVAMITRCTALQLAGYGIRCICVSPGELNNPQAEYIRPHYLSGQLSKEQAAAAVYSISQDEMVCINGSEIFLDDGYVSFKGNCSIEKDIFLGYRFREKLQSVVKNHSTIILFMTVSADVVKKIVDLIYETTKKVKIFTNAVHMQELLECINFDSIITYKSKGRMEIDKIETEITMIRQNIKPDCVLVPCKVQNGIGYENVYAAAARLNCDIYWLDVENGSIDKA